ncbi:MAG: ATP-binding protein [Ruminococcus sp.]|nr:ATP-binding protein [Ruminococcus sp.]
MNSEFLQSCVGLLCHTDLRTMITDRSLHCVWKNSSELPDDIDVDKFVMPTGSVLVFPIKETVTFKYGGDDRTSGSSAAMRVQPLYKGDEVEGYLVTVLTAFDVEMLSVRTGYSEYKTNTLTNIRLCLGDIVDHFEDRGGEDYDFVASKASELNSYMVNYEEIGYYLSGFGLKGKDEMVAEVLDRLCSRISKRCAKKGYVFAADLDCDGVVELNGPRLEAAVANLVANAYKYNNSAVKECRLSVYAKGDRTVIQVEDNGVGMDREQIKNALVPYGKFYSFGKFEHLGLAVVNAYCQRFGGELKIDSRPGGPTRVIMAFRTRPLSTAELRMPLPVFELPFDTVANILAKGLL